MMITALCANPCIDRSISVNQFVYSGMNRIKVLGQVGSGKGVNVAVAAATIGAQAACIGALPQEGSEAVYSNLAQAGCKAEFIHTPGRLRVNTKLLDESTGRITELNESGAEMTGEEIDQMIILTKAYAAQSIVMVLIGSVPKGVPKELYARLCQEISCEYPQTKVILDAEGELFSKGLKGKPYLVKPNQYELELLLGKKVESLDEVKQGAALLLKEGVRVAVITLGGDGAFIADEHNAYFAPALNVKVVSTVGAGDSMVAAMSMAIEQKKDLKTLFTMGMAASASAVTTDGTKLIDPDLYHKLLNEVEIEEMSL